MAIDTAAKRASALGDCDYTQQFVIPDGTIDQGDRQTIADCYGGILAAPLGIAALAITGLWIWDYYYDA